MSRRTLLAPIQNQRRAASRMTVGTRMWSEQPVTEERPRYWAPLLEEPGEEPLIPPSGMRYIDFDQDIGGPLTAYVGLAANEQTILFCTSANSQSTGGGAPQTMTIDPGWTILAQGVLAYTFWAIVTRNSYVNETVPVVSVGAETHSWNRLVVRGFAFLGEDRYKFIPSAPWQTVNPTVTLHAWGGDPSALRMRALVSDGCYNNWLAGLGNSSGHYQSELGSLSPTTSWWRPFTAPATYLTSAWAAGDSRHGSFGVYGPVTWIEYHIEVARA
jgi:hypothetical protein